MFKQEIKNLQLSYPKLLVVSVVLFFIGYAVAAALFSHKIRGVDQLLLQNEKLYQKIHDLEYQENILKVELDVEKRANRIIQRELTLALDEKAMTTRELTFYQRVMGADLATEGVAIDSLLVNSFVSQTGLYYFRLILVQLERSQPHIRGQLSIQIQGEQEGELVELDLVDIATSRTELNQFSMNFYQLFEGTFEIPSSFIPKGIAVQVSPQQGQSLERVYLWNELVNISGEPINYRLLQRQ